MKRKSNKTDQKGKAKNVGISVQVPEFVDEALGKIADSRFTSRNAIAREILVAHLKQEGALPA